MRQEQLQVRIGVATGLVIVGDLVGSGEAQERGVVGETPNLAASGKETLCYIGDLARIIRSCCPKSL